MTVGLRASLGRLYRSPPWRWGTGAVIFVNSVLLGVLTAVPADSADWDILSGINAALLGWMVLDVGLCIVVKGRAVLRGGWDIFDITVTLLSLVPRIETLSALRVLRVLRVLRLISFLPNVRATVEALFGALRNMAAAFTVLAVVFYCFMIIATNLFREIDAAHYGTLGLTAIYLYATMASFGSNLEAVLPVVRKAPWAWLVFAPFLMVTSFGLLNLFVAVIVAALRERLDRKNTLRERRRFQRLEAKIDALSERLAHHKISPRGD